MKKIGRFLLVLLVNILTLGIPFFILKRTEGPTPILKKIGQSFLALLVNAFTLGIPFIIGTMQFFKNYKNFSEKNADLRDANLNEANPEDNDSRPLLLGALGFFALWRYEINQYSLGAFGKPSKSDIENIYPNETAENITHITDSFHWNNKPRISK